MATALTAAEQGMLAKLPSPARIRLEDDEELEDEQLGKSDGYKLFVRDLEVFTRSLRPATRAKPSPPLPARGSRQPAAVGQPPLWEQLLDQARQQAGPETVVTHSVTREIRYVLDAARSSGGDLVLLVMERATGRLHIRTGPDQMTPASYDGERAWELVLVVERHATQRYTEVTGQLRRGDESLDLSVPLVLARAGWLLFPARISRFEHFNAFGLVVTLRQHQRIQVPRGQEEKLLAKLLALPGLPRLVLPAELALREITVAPQPVLKIGPPSQRASWRLTANQPVAMLFFDYQGERVPAGDARAIVPKVAERLIIRRDRTAERAAAEKLAGLGFKTKREPAWLHLKAPGDFEIASKKVPGAVRALLADGWQVEADGKLYRRPGRFSLEVTSGIDWFDLMATVDRPD